MCNTIPFGKTIMLGVLVFFMLTGTATSLQGQGFTPPSFGGVGGDSSSESSRWPFRVKLSGVLNPPTEPQDSLKVVTLVIENHREPYKFAVMTAEAVDNPQTPRHAILPTITQSSFDFRLVGSKELLSEIGQSPPGSPLTIVGFLQQRRHELTLIRVETVSAVTSTTPSDQE